MSNIEQGISNRRSDGATSKFDIPCEDVTLSSSGGSQYRTFSPLEWLPNTYRAFFGGFVHLHPVQRQAIAPILAGRDLVLQSATGSGKTEAVLAPCIERLIRSGRTDAVLYVVPTRALAIDLERRLTPVLGQRLGLQLGIRTGDVKRAGGGRPDLVLTTPESLDVLTGSANADLQRFMQRVRTVIIDEVHPFLHQYRGRQLACLLNRLERRTGRRLQKIALSATIADVDAVIHFFGFGSDAVRLISTVQRHIEPHLVHLKREQDEIVSLLDDLHHRWGYRKILMFANSRGQCDRLFALTNQRGCFRGISELHYSNLKPRERRAVEDRFRRRDRSLCIATSTLELGIDIGDVDGVLLFEPPDSVSAFLQRIGRSNRRESTTHFWGICRGERAGEQLLRFLGLLRLAGQGVVEQPRPNAFPSVMLQQVLSCLYEKKIISLPSVQDLFPESADALELIFPSMEKQGWMRRDELINKHCAVSAKPGPSPGKIGLFRGGWRYRDCFLDRRIWSNFPETEEDYALEISGEAVADLPHSIVRQLEPGDRVHLAGKRIRILEIIDFGERKRVLAEPTEELDEKEILWLGPGFHISFEVAQSMRAVLNSPEATAESTGLGLFSRTRRLIREERQKNSRAVTLANGIEVLREFNGSYRYRTFLGSMGNLILCFSIEHHLGGLDDFYTSSDEIGVTCSHWVDFRDLSLPVDSDGFRRWVLEHLRPMRALLPLNAFADALPDALLVKELTGFLYDPRVAERFSRYLSSPCEIVSGDPHALELPPMEAKGPEPVFLQPSASAPLLAYEKERWGIESSARMSGETALFVGQPSQAAERHVPRALTGTMIGEYLRHQQCPRWLSTHFLPSGLPDHPRRARTDLELDAIRTERGRQHEARVLAYLRKTGAPLHIVREWDDGGKRRSLEDRFTETLDSLDALASQSNPCEPVYLSQAVLMAPSLLAEHFDYRLSNGAAQSAASHAGSDSIFARIDGIGIPDIIRISMSEGGPLLEVGDVKDSLMPYYSQKWQVAFYALLLKEWSRSQSLPGNVEVSSTGFLFLRGVQEPWAPFIHPFDLSPFLAAFPALFQNMGEVFLNPPGAAESHLQGHCTTCLHFELCYRRALCEEDIQFIPQLTPGTLWKLRQVGWRLITDVE